MAGLPVGFPYRFNSSYFSFLFFSKAVFLPGFLRHFSFVIEKIQDKNYTSYRSFDAKINNDLRYIIQFLDARYNDFKLFPLPKKTLSNQLNDMKMAAEVKLASVIGMKLDNYAALREMISSLIKLGFYS